LGSACKLSVLPHYTVAWVFVLGFTCLPAVPAAFSLRFCHSFPLCDWVSAACCPYARRFAACTATTVNRFCRSLGAALPAWVFLPACLDSLPACCQLRFSLHRFLRWCRFCLPAASLCWTFWSAFACLTCTSPPPAYCRSANCLPASSLPFCLLPFSACCRHYRFCHWMPAPATARLPAPLTTTTYMPACSCTAIHCRVAPATASYHAVLLPDNLDAGFCHTLSCTLICQSAVSRFCHHGCVIPQILPAFLYPALPYLDFCTLPPALVFLLPPGSGFFWIAPFLPASCLACLLHFLPGLLVSYPGSCSSLNAVLLYLLPACYSFVLLRILDYRCWMHLPACRFLPFFSVFVLPAAVCFCHLPFTCLLPAACLPACTACRSCSLQSTFCSACYLPAVLHHLRSVLPAALRRFAAVPLQFCLLHPRIFWVFSCVRFRFSGPFGFVSAACVSAACALPRIPLHVCFTCCLQILPSAATFVLGLPAHLPLYLEFLVLDFTGSAFAFYTCCLLVLHRFSHCFCLFCLFGCLPAWDSACSSADFLLPFCVSRLHCHLYSHWIKRCLLPAWFLPAFCTWVSGCHCVLFCLLLLTWSLYVLSGVFCTADYCHLDYRFVQHLPAVSFCGASYGFYHQISGSCLPAVRYCCKPAVCSFCTSAHTFCRTVHRSTPCVPVHRSRFLGTAAFCLPAAPFTTACLPRIPACLRLPGTFLPGSLPLTPHLLPAACRSATACTCRSTCLPATAVWVCRFVARSLPAWTPAAWRLLLRIAPNCQPAVGFSGSHYRRSRATCFLFTAHLPCPLGCCCAFRLLAAALIPPPLGFTGSAATSAVHADTPAACLRLPACRSAACLLVLPPYLDRAAPFCRLLVRGFLLLAGFLTAGFCLPPASSAAWIHVLRFSATPLRLCGLRILVSGYAAVLPTCYTPLGFCSPAATARKDAAGWFCACIYTAADSGFVSGFSACRFSPSLNRFLRFHRSTCCRRLDCLPFPTCDYHRSGFLPPAVTPHLRGFLRYRRTLPFWTCRSACLAC